MLREYSVNNDPNLKYCLLWVWHQIEYLKKINFF